MSAELVFILLYEIALSWLEIYKFPILKSRLFNQEMVKLSPL